jgi:hypothetical protein
MNRMLWLFGFCCCCGSAPRYTTIKMVMGDRTVQPIFVLDCGGEYASIFADRKMTVALANPVIVSESGEFTTTATCLTLKIGATPGGAR